MALNIADLINTGQRSESMGNSGDNVEYDTLFTTPDGRYVYQRPNGTYWETYYGADGGGMMRTFDQQGNPVGDFATGRGSFWDNTLGRYGLGDIGTTVANDPRLMTFLALASGGAAASYAAGSGAAAGGAGATTGGGAATGATGTGLGTTGAGSSLGSGLTAGGAPAAAGMGGGTGLVAGGAPAAAGMGGGAGLTTTAAGGGTLGAGGVATGLGTATGVASTGLGGGSGASAGGSSLLSDAARWAAENPNLVGAGLGAIAGAASGSVDATSTGSRGLVDYALPAGQAYADMAQRTINGEYLGQGLGTNPYAGSNPYLGEVMDSVASRMTDAYRTGTSANTMSQFAQGGAFGGSAHQQLTALNNRAFADSLGSTLSGMQMQDYTQQQGLAENQLNRELQQFQNERGLMMGASQGLGNLGGTQTSTIQGVGPVQGALAGALGGWAMGQSYGASAPQQTGQLGYQGLGTNTQTNPYLYGYQGTDPTFGRVA